MSNCFKNELFIGSGRCSEGFIRRIRYRSLYVGEIGNQDNGGWQVCRDGPKVILHATSTVNCTVQFFLLWGYLAPKNNAIFEHYILEIRGNKDKMGFFLETTTEGEGERGE